MGHGVEPVAKNARLALVGAILGRQTKNLGLGLEPAPQSERSAQPGGCIAARALRSLRPARHAQVRPLGEEMPAREGAQADSGGAALDGRVEIPSSRLRRWLGGK